MALTRGPAGLHATPTLLSSPRFGWGSLVGALLGIACGPAQEHGEVSGASGPPRCGAPAPAPSLTEPAPLEPVKSHVALEFKARASWLEAFIADQIPVELGHGRHELGLPGRLEYTLRRGSLDLSVARDRLVLSTPVQAEVALCKPIAGFCAVYGRCSPRLVASVSIPTQLTDDYEVGPSVVTIPMTRGCRIVGFNADREVETRAAHQASKLKRELDRSMPRLHPLVVQGWRALHARFDLGPLGCLVVAPNGLSQSQPRLEEGVLSASVELTGTIELQSACPSDQVAGLELPALAHVAKHEPTLLELPLRLPWSVVARDIQAGLVTSSLGSSVQVLRAHGALVDGEPRIALELGLQGACEPLWLAAAPALNSETARVELHDVGLLPGSESPIPRARLALVAHELESFGKIPLLVSPQHALELLNEGLKHKLDASPDVQLALSARLEPTRGRVLLDATHLVPVVGLAGELTLMLHARAHPVADAADMARSPTERRVSQQH